MLLNENPLQKCTLMAISCHKIMFHISVSTRVVPFAFTLILVNKMGLLPMGREDVFPKSLSKEYNCFGEN